MSVGRAPEKEIPKFSGSFWVFTVVGFIAGWVGLWLPDFDLSTWSKIIWSVVVVIAAFFISVAIYAVKLRKYATAVSEEYKKLEDKHVGLARMHDDKIKELGYKQREIELNQHIRIEVLGLFLSAIATGDNAQIPATHNAYLKALEMIGREFL